MDATQKCVEHLRKLVAFHTDNPAGDEMALCSHLASELESPGADVGVTEVERPVGSGAYVYARFGSPSLLLNVHIDTVPANSGWTRDPFVAEVSNERVYGLGSCDIKGAAAAILTALETQPPENIAILFSGDEENGSRCMEHFLAHQDISGIETALVCEPTAKAAGLSHRGFQTFSAHFRGCGGHSSKADAMPKPVVELARLAVGLDSLAQDYADVGTESMKGICMNVASLEGGVAANVVPDGATLHFSLRPPPGFDAQEFSARLEEVRARAHPEIQIQPLIEHHPFACSQPERVSALLRDHVHEFVELDFWTEAALLEAAGIASVVIGPGDIAQAHAADEFVSIENLGWAVGLFQSLLARRA